MNAQQLEALFFRPQPATGFELAGRRRASSEALQSPPVRAENRPCRMDLASVLPPRAAALHAAGQSPFPAAGTGGVSSRGAQEGVAFHLAHQIDSSVLPQQPSLLFHLGDVVYYHGEPRRGEDSDDAARDAFAVDLRTGHLV